MSSKVTLQIVASLTDAARGVIYDRHMFIVQATGLIRAKHWPLQQSGVPKGSALALLSNIGLG